jgi:PadR family transcriptional regulator PadR
MNIQFKKGVLELCVLSMLLKGDRYGYDLSSSLTEIISISDGTIYPILRRLKTDGYVTTYLQESSGGPPRKYYQLTESGKSEQLSLEQEWAHFVDKVESIVAGGQEDA